MSRPVDEKIVKLTLEDKDFKTRAAESMKSLGALTKSFAATKGVDLSKTVNSLSSIKNQAMDTATNGMGRIMTSVNNLLERYPRLQTIANGALTNIGFKAVNAGQTLLKNMVLDPPRMGFAEYEDKMNSTQVIMSNTGADIKEVNAVLSDLNKYSDDTIYSFKDMTTNIGTFTAAGVKLNDAKTAIKGIANLAAVSGSNTQQAGTAMYQLSQALAAGKVGLQDWNSVVNAGMGGQKFQKALQGTADKLGVARDKTKSFRDSLQEGWLTSEVLLKTLDEFSKDESMIEAATKVRTFSQLLDTSQEAVQSGWAQTWEIVFGNFEESGDMWSSIAKSIAPVIDGMSKTRNETLQFLKDAGVFEQIKNIFANTFGFISNLIKAIKAPFSDLGKMFKSTGDTSKKAAHSILAPLESLTKALKDNKIILGAVKGAVSLLLMPIKALLAIIGILAKAFISLVEALPIKKLQELYKTFKETVGRLAKEAGAKLGEVAKWFDKVAQSVSKWVKSIDFTPVIDGIMDFVDSAITWLEKIDWAGIAQSVRDFVDKVKSYLPEIDLGPVTEKFNEFKDTVVTMFKTMDFSPIIDPIKEFANTVKEKVLEINSWFVSMGLTVEDFIAFYQGLAKGFKDGLWPGIVNGLSMLKDKAKEVIDYVQPKLSDFMKFLKEQVFTSENIARGSALAAVVTTLAGLYKVAKGISAATEAVGKVGDLAETVGDSFQSFSKSFSKSMKAKTLLTYAVAIGILAVSLYTLSKIDWKKLLLASATIGVFMLMLKKSMEGIYSVLDGADIKMGAAFSVSMSIMAIGGAVLLIAAAAKIFETIDGDKLAQSLGGVAVALAGMSAVMAVAGKLKVNPRALVGLAGVGLAVIAVAAAAKIFADMNLKQLATGLGAAGVALLELGIFAKIADKTEIKPATGVSLLLLAAGLTALAIPVKVFGSMKLETIGKGLLGLGGVLVAVGGFSRLVKANELIKTAAAIGLLGLAMTTFVPPLLLFGSMPMDKLTQGAVVMGGILVAVTGIAVGLGKLGGGAELLAFGVGLTAIAAGLTILAVPITLLGSLSLETIGKGLLAIGGALAVVLAAAAGAMIVGPGLMVLAGSFIAIGAGIALLSLGLAGLGKLLEYLSSVGADAITGIVENVKEMIDQFQSLIEPAKNFIIELITAFIETVVTLTPTFIAAGIQMITDFLTGIRDNIGPITEIAFDIVMNFMTAISEKIPELIAKAMEMILAFITGLADAIDKYGPQLQAAIGKLLTAIVNFFIQSFQGILKWFGKWIPGLVKGVKSGFETVQKTISKILGTLGGIAKKAWDAVTTAISNVLGTIKRNVQNGIDSVKNTVSRIFGTLGGIAKKAWDAVTGAISGVLSGVKSAASNVAEGAKNALSSGWNALKSVASGAWGKAKDGINAVKEGLRGAASGAAETAKSAFKGAADLYQAGKDMLSGAINGVKDMAGDFVESVKQAAGDAWNAFKKKLGIKSPSRVFMQLGRYIMEGAQIGVQQKGSAFVQATGAMADGAIQKVKDLATDINTEFGSMVDLNPTIKPSLDMSDIEDINFKDNTIKVDGMESLVTAAGTGGDSYEFHITGSAQDAQAIAREVEKIIVRRNS